VSQPELAYIDPGSGSMILQLILGGLAAAAVFLRMFWHRLLVFLHIREPYDAERATAPPSDAPPVDREQAEGVREPVGKR
jgi:hypothetical protein